MGTARRAASPDQGPSCDRGHGSFGDDRADCEGRARQGAARLALLPLHTRPWIRDEDFDPSSDPHLTEDEARAVDSAVDAYNKTIIDSVAAARENGLDWYLFDLGGFLDRLASKRYLADPAARPAWWTPYPLPPELAGLDPVPNTRFFASGVDGRTDGGLFSLDGIHPTTIGYGLIAQEVIAIMNLAQVEFRLPSGDRRTEPAGVDFSRVLASDTLLARPPKSLGGQMATLGWLDDRLDWVRVLFEEVRHSGSDGARRRRSRDRRGRRRDQ